MKFKIVDIKANTQAESSDSVYVEDENGVRYQVEWWSTDHGADWDVYLVTPGKRATEPAPLDIVKLLNDESAYALTEGAKHRFFDLWNDRVAPLIEQCAKEAIAGGQVEFEVKAAP